MLTVFHGGPSSRDWEKLSMLSDLFSDPWYFVESCASPVSSLTAMAFTQHFEQVDKVPELLLPNGSDTALGKC